MITPKEIQTKQFSKVMRGYKDEEVDMFLDLITLDLEQLLKENEELKSQVADLQRKVDGYQSTDSEAEKLLKQAQELMRDISSSADKRAQLAVRNAGLEADSIIREARERAARIDEENKRVRQSAENFKERYRRLLEDELAKLDTAANESVETEEVTRLEDLFDDIEFQPAKKMTDTLDMPTIISDSIPDAPGLAEDLDRRTVIVNMGEE